MENCQFERMLLSARERLSHHAADEIAHHAGVFYEDGVFSALTLGDMVRIHVPDCLTQPALSNWHTLTLLHYLDLADGTPLSGRMIPFSQYQHGFVRGGAFERCVEQTVRRNLAMLAPVELEHRCKAIGAEIISSNADFCARFCFAPYYPVWLRVWFPDEEFPASGRLLVDETAPHYLSIEDAVTVGSLILERLTGVRNWSGN